jgi:peroxiredoxin
VTQLGELESRYDELRAAGLSIFAVSVDRPEEQAPLERRLGGRVTFLSDGSGKLLDAIGVRHPDGVPWYDRLLLGARRQDIAYPTSLVVGKDGRIRWIRRSARVDERPPVDELVRSWAA